MLKVVQVRAGKNLESIRRLFQEYADSLGTDLSFQDFQNELENLPGEYVPPGGRLYLALEDSEPVACVAMRKVSDEICEMNRLYVRPLARGKGIGRKLALQLIADARRKGYQRLRLDTLPMMRRAIALYQALGFKPIDPYRHNPVQGARFFELTL